jgi:cation diffusion facilitator family transporter
VFDGMAATARDVASGAEGRPWSSGTNPITLEHNSVEWLQTAIQSEEALSKMSGAAAEFYRKQNLVIERTLKRRKTGQAWAVDLADDLEDADEEVPDDGIARTASDLRRAQALAKRAWAIKLAINLSFFVNLLLFALKLVAAFVTGSLTVISSAIDSGLDLFSGSIIFCTARVQSRKRPYHYPVGRNRLEPLSVVVFSAVMGMTSLVILKEAASNLVHGISATPAPLVIDIWAWVSIGGAVLLKFFLFLYCSLLSAYSPSLKALRADHRNDVLTNIAALISIGITFAEPGAWWVDPLTAILLALYILYNWVTEGWEQIRLLTGHVASNEQLNDLTRIAHEYSDLIQFVDTVRAYHVGSRLLAEIDIVLDPTMSLRDAHDIGQELQLAVERIESIERVYVHLDYSVENPQFEHVAPDLPKAEFVVHPRSISESPEPSASAVAEAVTVEIADE